MSLTYEDIVQALQDALASARTGAPNIDYSLGLASIELAEHLGTSQETARTMLKKGIKAGTVEYVGRARRPNMSGGHSAVPVYRPVDKE